LDLSSNNSERWQAVQFITPVADMLRTESAILELSIAHNCLSADAFDVLAGGMQANSSLTSLNVLNNGIGFEQARRFLQIKADQPILRTLCGATMEETDLDLSHKTLRPEDAFLLFSDIKSNRELQSVNMSGTGQHLPEDIVEPLKDLLLSRFIFGETGAEVTLDVTMTEANLSKRGLNSVGAAIVAGFVRRCR
jgi:hypothetical protein